MKTTIALLLAMFSGSAALSAHSESISPVIAVTSSTVAAAASFGTLNSFEQSWLSEHNEARVRYGREPLQWDRKLSQDAYEWAQHLTQIGQLEHAPHGHGQGENLWMGTHQYYAPANMVDAWVREESIMKSGKFPDVTKSGNWADVGHMTQLLWPSTTHVGCAMASSAEWDVLVCRYSPPGNWMGEYFDAKPKYPQEYAGY